MAEGEDLRRLALALPGTSEAPHFERAAFRVARIYATMPPDGRTANLRLAPDEQALKCLTAPEAFAAVPNAWGRQGWTTVVLEQLSLPELEAALRLAWGHAQPSPPRRQNPSGAKRSARR